MDFTTFNKIKDIVDVYSREYIVGNRKDLGVFMEIINIDEEKKEFLLCELDKKMPLGVIFTHDYNNGRLKIVFRSWFVW